MASQWTYRNRVAVVVFGVVPYPERIETSRDQRSEMIAELRQHCRIGVVDVRQPQPAQIGGDREIWRRDERIIATVTADPPVFIPA